MHRLWLELRAQEAAGMDRYDDVLKPHAVKAIAFQVVVGGGVGILAVAVAFLISGLT
jgi:hypothetical protein